nr:hypothetical protein Iba_chr02aCG7160 [Ipomoea batatas]GMC60009.1 hypothetical protein Iba_chr02bCG6760 [Ipomoea batatas]GMC66247.1 hypothetical protein Iba_chr02eCG3870 [Ipomoea batatas]
MKFKGYRKLEQSFIHTSMVNCMGTESGLGLSMELELFLYSLLTIPHFSAMNEYTDTTMILNDLPIFLVLHWTI